MARILTRVLLTALVLLLLSEYVPGIAVRNVTSAIVAALVIGLLNVFVRPLLIFLTLPVTILTLGLFIFIINATLFYVAAALLPGFSVDNWWWALAGSLVLSLVSALTARYVR